MGVLTERRQALVDRLRSGKDEQTQFRLCVVETNPFNRVGKCCLGVACEVAIDLGLEVSVSTERDPVYRDGTIVKRYDGETTFLPESVQAYYGFLNCDGRSTHLDGVAAWSLVGLNDNLTPFEKIADVLVERQHEIFTPDPDGSRIV